MPVLNPFLRALFQSSVLAQALPSQNYVLLVPTSESLLNGIDRETGRRYTEEVDDEDFLGSHILRISSTITTGKDSNIRDNRSKAKTYPTVTGRSVIIKDNNVYSNKGFKQLNQAQLLHDAIYYSPASDMQQWLIYYISAPLIGIYDAIPIVPAIIGEHKPEITSNTASTATSSPQLLHPAKKDIKTFNELLSNFPMISRQMQPGLDRLFNEFGKELGKPLPPPPSRSSTTNSLDGTTVVSDAGSIRSNGSIKLPFNSPAYFEDEEDLMRRALETAVTAGIDLFQGVDKQQLSYLGATTDLTGPAVERLIEKYIAESVHETLVFPRLCSFHRFRDQELDRRIRQMDCLDVSQVGIAMEDGQNGKKELLDRIDRGVMKFRKIGIAGSPQEMLDILLETQKAVSESARSEDQDLTDAEKQAAALTINADILVSLLLLVVIRSQIRHLHARLSYMQRFIYIEDVESGEIGYALSTLEAVLVYLAKDASGLRKASKQNKFLWDAVKTGNLDDMKTVFEGNASAIITEEPLEELQLRPSLSRINTGSNKSVDSDMNGSITRTISNDGGLSHVFPFQANETLASPIKRKKRVHMDARSMSISSSFSMLSRTATIETTLSGIEGDTSVESLAQTQDVTGNSVLMMAVETQQIKSLQYLLSLSEFYAVENVLADSTVEGTTLLSAAIQLANKEIVDMVLKYIMTMTDEITFRQYLSKRDSRGRTAAHYLFNTPYLIDQLGDKLPWSQKDKIGHTPLFAICRSYDHADYSKMVSEALVAAKNSQSDNSTLRIEDHIDNKGNSLLHIINDAVLMQSILDDCDVDPNIMNDKKLTPLMLASKYGRIDLVRVFFGDSRIDLQLKESRGLTAVELAKDDEVRNKIDDLTLFSTSAANPKDATGRITAIVRSFFVEDGSTRLILKSGAPNSAVSSTTFTITTSRRSLQDFENLVKWLSMDNPASYMPVIIANNFRTPFQIHSRPSRAMLHDAQTYLDRFLRILMTHPTFSTHEMLWEFFLVPEMLPELIVQRATLMSELLKERIAEEYEPMISKADLTAVDTFLLHSRDLVRRLGIQTRMILRRGNIYSHAYIDIAEAISLLTSGVLTLGPPATALPRSHVDAVSKLSALLFTEPSSSPLLSFTAGFQSLHSTILAMQTALLRPTTLIAQIISTQRTVERNRSALVSGSIPKKGIMNLNFPGTEENRLKSLRDTEKKIIEGEIEIERLGKELRYTHEVVVGELAGWTTWREGWGRAEIKKLAKSTLVKERERLKSMQRILRTLQEQKSSDTN